MQLVRLYKCSHIIGEGGGFFLKTLWCPKTCGFITVQAQGRLQQSKITENKFEELKAQYRKDTQEWKEQLKNYQRQLRAAEKTIKDNNQTLLKEQMKVKKHEQKITHMQQLLPKKEMETKEKLLQELDKQKKVAQEAVERAAVRSSAMPHSCQLFTDLFLNVPQPEHICDL